MNKPLTIALLRGEVKRIMKRVAKADRRLASGNLTGGSATESEEARKQRLLGRVTEIEAQIKEIERGEATA